MLGPLPKMYRVLVSLASLAVFVGVGAWAAFLLPYPELVSVGASVGLGIGAVCAFLLVRESRASAHARPQHGRHRRLP